MMADTSFYRSRAPNAGFGSPALPERLADGSAARVAFDGRVIMADGVELSVDVYRSESAGARPTILSLTPYSRYVPVIDVAGALERGFAVVNAYCRGTGRSGGRFLPLETDDADGAAIIAWVRAQAWSDGRVVMVGRSYEGGNQWRIASRTPEGLVAICPHVAVYPAHWFQLLEPYNLRWLISFKRTTELYYGGSDAHWARKYLDTLHQPLRDRCAAFGLDETQSANVARWMTAEGYDARRRALSLSPDDYRRIAAAGIRVLTVAGLFDSVIGDSLTFLRQWDRAVPTGAVGAHAALLGPWHHETVSRLAFGGLTFEAVEQPNLSELVLDWFDHVLGRGPWPEFLRGRITYHLAGLAGGWRGADSLEAPVKDRLRLYLAAGLGQGADLTSPGSLEKAAPGLDPASLRIDPLAPDDGDAEPGLGSDDEIVSLRSALACGAKLVYCSAPYPHTLTVIGEPRLEVHGMLDAPCADVEARLHVIDATGRAIRLGSGLMRARYCEDPFEPSPAEPGVSRCYRFDFGKIDRGPLSFCARRFGPGARVLLVLKPPTERSFGRNYHTGGVVGDEDASSSRVATLTVGQRGDQASFLELPLGEDG